MSKDNLQSLIGAANQSKPSRCRRSYPCKTCGEAMSVGKIRHAGKRLVVRYRYCTNGKCPNPDSEVTEERPRHRPSPTIAGK